MNQESAVGRIEALGRNLNHNGSVNISCHTASMPSRTLMTYPHTQHSAPFTVPYSQNQYDPITFSFYASSHLRQRHFFDVWQTAVINLNDNSLNFFEEYTSDIDIWQLDRAGEVTYGVRLYAAWPLMVANVDYGYGTNNSVQNVSVTMSYKLWKSNNDTTSIVIY